MITLQEIIDYWTQSKIESNLDRNTFEREENKVLKRVVEVIQQEINDLKIIHELTFADTEERISEAEYIKRIIELRIQEDE